MAMTTFENFAGLIGMGRRHGIDTKPTLLRVLTDLYLQKAQHTSAEARQFTELAIGLIGAVDAETRHAVAVRLATLREPPAEVMAKLTNTDADETDMPGIDPAIQDHSSEALANELAPAHHVGRTLDAPAISMSQNALPAPAQALQSAADEAATSLCALFFSAGPEERRLIMTNLEFAAAPASAQGLAHARDASARLEHAVLSGRPGDFVRELEAALHVSRDLAERIVNDPSGEPLVGAARALSIPIEVLQRILLFVNPAIGHSVRRVFDLSTLYQDISPDSAAQLVALWRRASPRKSATHGVDAGTLFARRGRPERSSSLAADAAPSSLKSQRTT